jgi:hypothetical protein
MGFQKKKEKACGILHRRLFLLIKNSFPVVATACILFTQ